jgi:hypothetical protein
MEDEEKTQIRHRVTNGLLFEAKVEGKTKAARLGFAVKAALEAKIDLRSADLSGANLQGADLEGADLDFSSGIPFRCWSFGFKCDFRLIAQIMCHVARLESDDPQAMEIIAEVRHRWGNDFCEFRDDVLPGNWDEESKEGSEKTPCP